MGGLCARAVGVSTKFGARFAERCLGSLRLACGLQLVQEADGRGRLGVAWDGLRERALQAGERGGCFVLIFRLSEDDIQARWLVWWNESGVKRWCGLPSDRRSKTGWALPLEAAEDGMRLDANDVSVRITPGDPTDRLDRAQLNVGPHANVKHAVRVLVANLQDLGGSELRCGHQASPSHSAILWVRLCSASTSAISQSLRSS